MYYLQPSESVGNVGQLCIDLLTTTLGSLPSSELKRVGYIYSPALLPAVGNDAFATYKSPPTGELCTAMEGIV